jgi:hypothetical protein
MLLLNVTEISSGYTTLYAAFAFLSSEDESKTDA